MDHSSKEISTDAPKLINLRHTV